MCLKRCLMWSDDIEKVMDCCEKIVVGHPNIEQKLQLLRVDMMKQRNELQLNDALRFVLKCLNTFREHSELYPKISRMIFKFTSPWVFQFLARFNSEDRELLLDMLFILRLEPDTFCPKYSPEAVSNLAERLLHLLLQIPSEETEVIDAITRSIGLIWERHFYEEEWLRKNLVGYFDTVIYGGKKLESGLPLTNPSPEAFLPFAALLNYIPKCYIPACAKEVVSKYLPNNDIGILLDRFYIFLQWHTDNDLFAQDLVWSWLLNLFSSLVTSGQKVMIVYFANQRIIDLIRLLLTEKIAEGVMTVVEFLTYTYQHHHQILEKVFREIPKVCLYYLSQLTVVEGDILIAQRMGKRLSELACVTAEMIRQKHWPVMLPPELVAIMSRYPALTPQEIEHKIAVHKWKKIAVIHRETQANVSFDEAIRAEASKQSPASVVRSETGYVGLRNLVNTCYANATIQMLFTCETFRRGILTLDPSVSHLIRTVQVLFQMLQSEDVAVSNPQSFLEVSRPSHFYPHAQQDASEYLTFVLDQLEEVRCSSELKSVKSSRSYMKAISASPNEPEPMEAEDDEEVSEKQEDPQLAPVTQLVREMFEGKYESTNCCAHCGTSNRTAEVFKLLSLPVQGQTSVEEMLRAFFCDEHQLDDWRCETCHTVGAGRQTIRVRHLPPYLILCLKIFAFDRESAQTTKITQNISVASHLDVNGSAYSYNFFGTVLHHGSSLHCGHYTYMWRKNEKFIHFDDSTVHYSSYDEVIAAPNTTPYILVYKRE